MYKKIGKKVIRSYKRSRQISYDLKKLKKTSSDWRRSKLIAEEKLSTRINAIKKRNPSISKKELKKELLKWNVRPSKGHTIYTMSRRGTSYRKFVLKELRKKGVPKKLSKSFLAENYEKLKKLKR